jgi:hypothetical protein
MALSVDTADQIVDLISNDVECCSCIEGPTGWGLFSELEIAGGVRNFFLLYGAGLSKDDALFIRVCCIGIARATSKAISAGAHEGALTSVRTSYLVSRVVGGFAHSAAAIWMNDGTGYVFDWWRTLEPDNPVIYRYFDWMRARGGVQYEDFTGF